MDGIDNTITRGRPLAASFSEASIESQLLEHQDEETAPSPPATDETWEESTVSGLLTHCVMEGAATQNLNESTSSSTITTNASTTQAFGAPLIGEGATSEINSTLRAKCPSIINPVSSDGKGAPFESGETVAASCSVGEAIEGNTLTQARPDCIDEDEGQSMDIDEDKDDASSELSEGDDLRDDLEDALHDKNFSFKGSFYHAGLLTAAPNPCLYISGLGLVGLPLSERDAKSIISCATLAPFGHGECTLVDKGVRDTWEIEPARITFANPDWVKYINGAVCSEVCQSLGVTVGNSPPKMELYKLLLYEQGSHFLPHQDTQKANGMFATVIVLLPSAYTGGQVIVSHASTTKTIDFAPNSLLSTALLAWYTDVKHEVQPVTSGYRLGLSYNLIHVAPPGVPRPSLPDMNGSVDRLRRVLQKWREDKYEELPDPRMIVHILDHQYSEANLREGSKTLKGADAHRVIFLSSVADELGYKVGLASLEHNVTGYGDDHGGHYHRRGRYYDDEDDDSESGDYTPDMEEVESTSTSISQIIDLNGKPLLSFGTIELGSECVIPRDPFEDANPDRTEYEGYLGNGAGSLDHWYHRTALILMHEDDVDDICFSVQGLSFAFEKLKKSATIPPTPDDRFWAIRIMGKSCSLNKEQALTMLELSLKWNDLEIWKTIMKSPVCVLGNINMDMLLRAWKTFSFETVRLSFEDILARSNQLQAQISFIYNLRPKASPDEKELVWAWCKKESDKVLSSYTTPDAKDIPAIMSIIRIAGLDTFITMMLPNLLKSQRSYTFWIMFVKTIREGRKAIVERLVASQTPVPTIAPLNISMRDSISSAHSVVNPTQPEAAPENVSTSTEKPTPGATTPVTPEQIIDTIIGKCLQAASSQWSDAVTQSSNAYGRYPYVSHNSNNVPQTAKIDRIIEIIDQAILSDSMDVCRTLLVDVLKSPGTPSEKFSRIYTPLIPRLRTLLQSRNLNLCTPPFVALVQVFIGTYLRDVLGKKGQIMNCRLRKIGCGCGDCGPLDKFILDPMSTSQLFRLAQVRRQHLETRVASAPDLCTFETIRNGSPHGLQVTKRREVINASNWANRQKEAKIFLTSIGSNEVIAKIMGARYTDVTLALSGASAFGGIADVPARPGVAAAASIASSSGTTHALNVSRSRLASASSSTIPPLVAPIVAPSAVPAPQASKKRKNGPIVQLGFIDLTGEDSS